MPRTNGNTLTRLQELAAYVAAGRESGPEELLRLARLAIAEVTKQVDAHPALSYGIKWRLIRAHARDGHAGLDPINFLLAHAEESLVEELREAARFPVCQPDVSPTSAPEDALLAGRA